MKTLTVLILFLCTSALCGNAQMNENTLVSSESHIEFYSSAPLEDIEAVTTEAKAIINLETNQILAKIPIHSFAFEKKLMQEHFNENYMESDLYPSSLFKGFLNGSLNIDSLDTPQEASVTGTLLIHGVSQERTLTGTVERVGNTLVVNTEFMVMLADHDIKIPKVVIKNIAEEIQVTCRFVFELP